MVEQRVIGPKIGARPIAPAAPAPEHKPDAPAEGEKPAKKGHGKLVVVLVVLLVVVVLAAGAVVFLLRGKAQAAGPAAPAPTPTPVAGNVLDIDPVSVNLADGHYLRLGLALQLSTDVTEDPDPARALDLAIALYSGQSVDDVSAPATRDKLKGELLGELQQTYGPGVMDVYLTDYVTQ